MLLDEMFRHLVREVVEVPTSYNIMKLAMGGNLSLVLLLQPMARAADARCGHIRSISGSTFVAVPAAWMETRTEVEHAESKLSDALG